MRRFQKRPDVSFAFIPGVGRLTKGQILEGEQYARFAPSLLIEILDAPALPTPKFTPPPAVIVPPPPPPAPSPIAPRPTTMAEAGFASPEELVAAVDEENKQTQAQIEQAVERLNPMDEVLAEVNNPPPSAPARAEPEEEPKKKEAPKPKPGNKKSSGRR